ncbi:MAG: GID complex subunit containing RING finger motif [Bathelium mastoideum]|nr:MAG: GID complex subunit containing RING finger motif [Bathelium mastoideum]
MNELVTTKLNADSHLLLDQPLLKVPNELGRKNFKTTQRLVERERENILSILKTTAHASFTGTSPLENLDSMIDRMTTLKRRLSALQEEEKTINAHSRKRMRHLQDLYEIPSLADVKYDEWSRIRLNRLLVDYLLRKGFFESARQLAKEKDMEELVDVDAFVQCRKIEGKLRQGDLTPCLNWCADNKQSLKKINSNLEIELRLQQYIELVRTADTQKRLEAIAYARKYLTAYSDPAFTIKAAGLLACSPDTATDRYQGMYSPDRYPQLATLFLHTHHTLFSLPALPPLQIALSAGLSALKTPACHAARTSTSSNTNSSAPQLPSAPAPSHPAFSASAGERGVGRGSAPSLCPICSPELNALARGVPYAHHTKSWVENDPVVLPNGRVYGRERLMGFNEKVGRVPGRVRDPVEPETVFEEDEIKKVFIS